MDCHGRASTPAGKLNSDLLNIKTRNNIGLAEDFRYQTMDTIKRRPTTFSEFILAVCGQDTTIDFWGAVLTCRLDRHITC